MHLSAPEKERFDDLQVPVAWMYDESEDGLTAVETSTVLAVEMHEVHVF